MTALKHFCFKLAVVYYSLQGSVAKRRKHEANNQLTYCKESSNPLRGLMY